MLPHFFHSALTFVKFKEVCIMNKKPLFVKISMFLLGTAVNAFGITLITKAYLGTSPISSLPFVLSLGLSPSFGDLTFLFNMLFFLGQLLLLRRDFERLQLLQIPTTVGFSLLIDFFMSLFGDFKPSSYTYSVMLLVLGCLVMALGITLSVHADWILTPGNAFVSALSKKTEKPYGTVEIAFDSVLTILAIIASFTLFGRFRGVREGTVASALLVGSFINLYQRLYRRLNSHFSPSL